jgi:hypothetical protein
MFKLWLFSIVGSQDAVEENRIPYPYRQSSPVPLSIPYMTD